jgi:hypothetical protein
LPGRGLPRCFLAPCLFLLPCGLDARGFLTGRLLPRRFLALGIQALGLDPRSILTSGLLERRLAGCGLPCRFVALGRESSGFGPRRFRPLRLLQRGGLLRRRLLALQLQARGLRSRGFLALCFLPCRGLGLGLQRCRRLPLDLLPLGVPPCGLDARELPLRRLLFGVQRCPIGLLGVHDGLSRWRVE